MSRMFDIQKVVLQTPGVTVREVAKALGLDDSRADRTRISALLTQCWQRGKLERAQDPDGKMRYTPTATTCVDGRNKRCSDSTTAERQRVVDQRRRAAKQQKREQKMASYSSPQARPPLPASHITVAEPPRPTSPPKPAGGVESVAEFRARGGVVQTLPPGYCAASTLRFEHERAEPIARRRGSIHQRKAGAP